MIPSREVIICRLVEDVALIWYLLTISHSLTFMMQGHMIYIAMDIVCII